jgi:hypothetical protein
VPTLRRGQVLHPAGAPAAVRAAALLPPPSPLRLPPLPRHSARRGGAHDISHTRTHMHTVPLIVLPPRKNTFCQKKTFMIHAAPARGHINPDVIYNTTRREGGSPSCVDASSFVVARNTARTLARRPPARPARAATPGGGGRPRHAPERLVQPSREDPTRAAAEGRPEAGRALHARAAAARVVGAAPGRVRRGGGGGGGGGGRGGGP